MAARPSLAYLDYNASTPVRPEVTDAMAAALATAGNPSSVHQAGRQARRLLDEARDAVAALAGVSPPQVVFTGSGTEANNQALASVAGPKLVSAIEHDSVLAAVPEAGWVPVQADGLIDLEALERRLEELQPRLVSVMLANNETGVIQPLAEVVALCRRHGARVHCDAVQAAGKLDLDLGALGVDFLTLSAHKLGGPQGVGALVLGPEVEALPLIRGGAQEQRRRAGTENLPGIAGFGRAATLQRQDTNWSARVGALRDRLEAEILKLAPAARIFGRNAPRLAGTSCLTMPAIANETQLIALDLDGVAISTGAACSSGKVGPSHVLAAMGVAPTKARTAIRVSLGWASRDTDVDRFLAAWARLYARAGGQAVVPGRLSA